jgi:large subunit ribosomal protein L21
MYAVLTTGGKQYKVKENDLIDIERISGDVGNEVTFSEIIAVGEEGGELKAGTPTIEGATVNAEIIDQYRGKKLIVFKMKKRKGYRRKKGHRQELTRIKISAISA